MESAERPVWLDAEKALWEAVMRRRRAAAGAAVKIYRAKVIAILNDRKMTTIGEMERAILALPLTEEKP